MAKKSAKKKTKTYENCHVQFYSERDAEWKNWHNQGSKPWTDQEIADWSTKITYFFGHEKDRTKFRICSFEKNEITPDSPASDTGKITIHWEGESNKAYEKLTYPENVV